MKLRAKLVAGAIGLAGLALILVLWAPFTSAGASGTSNFLVTLYGWPDNTPPGGDIAYPVLHHSAGGTGTYADPVTFASDRSELPVGTRIYLPFLHRYFIMEDDCTECDKDWTGHGPDGGPRLHHVDLWAGGEGAHASRDVIHCEDDLTRESAAIIIDPPATEPVDTSPLFDSSDDACYDPARFRPSAAASPTPPASAPAPTHQPESTPQASGSSFAAVTGPGCRPNSGASFAWPGPGTAGLARVPSGGPAVAGCDGSFDSMLMSGSVIHDDPGVYVLWTFHTAPIVHGTCHIDVYMPDDPNAAQVGGHPASYEVFDSASTAGPELGTFEIDQIFNRGRWASRHNWHITSGTLTVKLDSRGVSSAGGGTSARLAISDVSLTCV
jgi:hypothetical protein